MMMMLNLYAGYDMKSEDGYEQMKVEFDAVVGHEYLKAIHLNDSKGRMYHILINFHF